MKRAQAEARIPVDEAAAPEPTDGELVARARAGDAPAFAALVRRHQRAVYRRSVRLVQDHDTAADLVQRSFIRALQSLHELRDPQQFRRWLFRVAANLTLNHFRERARFVDGAALEHVGALPPTGHADLEAAETAQALQRAVSGLPTRQREVVELRVYRELPYCDIARALDTTANAAKVSFHHAVKALRRRLVVSQG